MGECCKTGDLHVIVTRFNVNISTAKTKEVAKINPATDVGYLDRRFTLFETYTVPSIQTQTNQNFIWVVLFHADIPQKYKEKIARLQQEYPVFHPIFVGDTQDVQAVLSDVLLQFAAKRYIISRIDNDDAFHASFVAQVQKMVAADATSEYVIIFPYGVQYHENQRIAANYIFDLNHFSTLVTVYDGQGLLKNILDYNHMKVGSYFTLKQVALAVPMWLEVIHDNNISNRMHVERKQIVRDAASLSAFGMPLPIGKYAYYIAYFYAIFQAPLNAMRLVKMYGVKGCAAKVIEKLRGTKASL